MRRRTAAGEACSHKPEPVKHGFYARHLRADAAPELQEAAAQPLNGEVALARVAARVASLLTARALGRSTKL